MLGRIGMRELRANECGPKLCRRRSGAIVTLALALLFGTAPGVSVADETVLWRTLSLKGYVALLRHAIAPGTGDPSGFALGDCRTQRNLSEEGREQAARIGALFRENGMEKSQVFSSQWCRCLETARLLGLGPVTELPMLNSFFQRPERRNRQTQELEKWLASQDLDGPLVLVTHQVNITALTGVYPASGDLVVIRPLENGKISAVGTIKTD